MLIWVTQYLKPENCNRFLFQLSSRRSSGVFVSVCSRPLQKKSPRDCNLFLSGKYYLLYKVSSLSILILSGPIRYSHRVIWCVASKTSAQRKSFFTLISFFSFCSGNHSFFDYWSNVSITFLSCILFEWF